MEPALEGNFKFRRETSVLTGCQTCKYITRNSYKVFENVAIKESDLTILVRFHYTSLSIGTNAKFASNNLIDSCFHQKLQ